ncbi:flagellar hook protein FlgE [Vibrio astriarenae]|nr:flagellar hook protein FlgE [Vibrio sp. C7]
MSFSIALSGLNASNSELNTISNNIANVSTAGFKESRTELHRYTMAIKPVALKS